VDPRLISPHDLRLSAPEIFEAKATQTGAKRHVRWFVGYAPEPQEGTSSRVVFAAIHAFNESGGAEVSCASLISHPSDFDPTNEEFEQALRDSEALETLYDFLQPHVRSLLAMVNCGAKVPSKAPKPKFSRLKRASEDSEGEAVSDSHSTE